MSNFFQDVGDFIAEPFRDIYGLVDPGDNPKRNSLGDIFNANVGPDNSFSRIVSDTTKPLVGWTGADPGKAFQTAPWEEQISKPGQAFYDQVNYQNQALPSVFQPFAEPAEALGLSVFNPFAGAAFQTAYEGGQQQANEKGFDWGNLGKDAAINFGTAGIATGAKAALQGAQAANSLNAFKAAPASLESGFNAANSLDGLTSVGTSAATPGFAASLPSALANGSTTAFNSIGAVPSAVEGFNPNIIGASQSIDPTAGALQSSGHGIVDSAYQASLKGPVQSLGGAVLNSTLAPTATQPIQGSLDGFSAPANATNYTPQYGDILNAFGGGEVNTANPNGPRITSDNFNQSVNRLAANDYLQQNQVRDTSLPAGQYQASQNSPYQHQLNDISKGTTQAYSDLLNETNNANAYYSIIDSNPGLTTDQLNAYLNDPSTGVLGNFSITPDVTQALQNIHPLGPRNTSLLNSPVV